MGVFMYDGTHGGVCVCVYEYAHVKASGATHSYFL